MRILSGVLFFYTAIVWAQTPIPASLSFHNHLFNTTCCLVVSHAGGGIEGNPYTSSKEAMDANYALGRRIFELDIIQTSDGAWVAAHDWKSWAKYANYKDQRDTYAVIRDYLSSEPYIPTKAEFVDMKLLGRFTPMTLEDIVMWLQQHPDVILLPDLKNSLQDFMAAAKSYGLMDKQIIMQAYYPEDLEYLKSQSIPLSRVIFANYKAELTEAQLVALLQQQPIGALTLSRSQALAYAGTLHQHFPQLPIYVHGLPMNINSFELQYRLKQVGVTGFYLD